MRPLLFAYTGVVMLAAASMAADNGIDAPGQIVLVRDGRPRFRIIVPAEYRDRANPNRWADDYPLDGYELALADLATYTAKIAGTQPPIVIDPPAPVDISDDVSCWKHESCSLEVSPDRKSGTCSIRMQTNDRDVNHKMNCVNVPGNLNDVERISFWFKGNQKVWASLLIFSTNGEVIYREFYPEREWRQVTIPINEQSWACRGWPPVACRVAGGRGIPL